MQPCSCFPYECPPCACAPRSCKPCCGYIVEEIRSHRREHCCFNGRLEMTGLPHGVPPLTLCSAEVTQITPSGESPCTFLLTLRCLVEDGCGRRMCGKACMPLALRQRCCADGGQLRLGAKIDVEEARYCPPCAFFVRAQVHIVAITSGDSRILRQDACPNPCPFPPLYPAPMRGCTERRTLFRN